MNPNDSMPGPDAALDRFLRQHTPVPPLAPSNEREALLRKIDELYDLQPIKASVPRRSRLWIPSLLGASLALFLVIGQIHKRTHQEPTRAEVEAVLYEALQYDAEESAEGDSYGF